MTRANLSFFMLKVELYVWPSNSSLHIRPHLFPILFTLYGPYYAVYKITLNWFLYQYWFLHFKIKSNRIEIWNNLFHGTFTSSSVWNLKKIPKIHTFHEICILKLKKKWAWSWHSPVPSQLKSHLKIGQASHHYM